MILRVKYLFTHEKTGKTYITENYYEDGYEAIQHELENFNFPDGEFTWTEYEGELNAANN